MFKSASRITASALALTAFFAAFTPAGHAQEPLREMKTVADWKALSAELPLRPVILLLVTEDGTNLENELAVSAERFGKQVAIVKVNGKRVDMHAIAAATDCDADKPASDDDSCAALFNHTPERFALRREGVLDFEVGGETLSQKEVDDDVRGTIDNFGHQAHSQDI